AIVCRRGVAGRARAPFYATAPRPAATASLDHLAALARADGRAPVESITTILDAEFIRLSNADGSIPDHARTDADPYAIEEPALKRLHRIIVMRKHLASSRLTSERAATHRADAERHRNAKKAAELR